MNIDGPLVYRIGSSREQDDAVVRLDFFDSTLEKMIWRSGKEDEEDNVSEFTIATNRPSLDLVFEAVRIREELVRCIFRCSGIHELRQIGVGWYEVSFRLEGAPGRFELRWCISESDTLGLAVACEECVLYVDAVPPRFVAAEG